MTKRKRSGFKPQFFESKRQKHREVRDVYNKLRKKYKLEVVYDCLRRNYFLQNEGVDYVINVVDKEPVDLTKASEQYKILMREDFYI